MKRKRRKGEGEGEESRGQRRKKSEKKKNKRKGHVAARRALFFVLFFVIFVGNLELLLLLFSCQFRTHRACHGDGTPPESHGSARRHAEGPAGEGRTKAVMDRLIEIEREKKGASETSIRNLPRELPSPPPVKLSPLPAHGVPNGGAHLWSEGECKRRCVTGQTRARKGGLKRSRQKE